jgi:hypothetical protein
MFQGIGEDNLPFSLCCGTQRFLGRNALKAAFAGVDPINGLFTDNHSAPLGVSAGLRQEYKFGLQSYCAYVDGTHGVCGRHSAASKFQPYFTITSDMPLNYSQFSNAVIPVSTFRDDQYLQSFSKTAYYVFLLGFIFSGLALLWYVVSLSLLF